ncbi:MULTISPECIES: Yip1 family protein [Bacillaceae]|uniref:Yip1 family protein n=1 Tax=Bacillaceae TaxID=186817 RepID=UPI00104C099F|nr:MULTISPECIES: Yip1 family protein [Bacillaceae]MDT2047991.1 Yip1 family protein [Priestia flexa]TDB53120.1 YIP1 family protein [Bacillus sp. CBEL-1]USY55923.1 YIP1 family protein [Bacillus sp. 1780r2a1]
MNPEIATTEQEQGPKPSVFKFIFSPGAEFDKMKQRPAIVASLILVILLSAAAFALSTITPENLASLQELGLEPDDSMKLFSMIGAGIGALIVTPIAMLIGAGILLLIVKIGKGTAKYKHMFSLTAFITFITMLGLLLNTVIAVVAGTGTNITSLNGLVGAEGAVGGVLASIEIFSIWSLILTAMGLQKVGGLSKKAAIIIASVFFVLSVISQIIGSVMA